MIDRHLSAVLLREAARMPVVTLTGPRQSGKSTLVRALFPKLPYLNLERPDIRLWARKDPLDLLARHPDGLVLDEVQRAPDLLSYIQVSVDEDPRPGRFLLTGSANLLLLKGVSQTLAGRSAVLHLYPFSLAELRGRPPLDLDGLVAGEAGGPPEADRWEILWKGLFPRIHDQRLDPTRWLGDYHRTYVERDLRDLLQVMNLDPFDAFVRAVAARTAQELNLNALAEDVGISQPTARSWLNALSAGFLITILPPYHQNFRKRLRKRPKVHFLDTGLACYLLGIPDAATLASHPLRGALFESFVVGEIHKAFVHAGRDPTLYHWRDATGHEVDCVIVDGQRVIPLEVKSGSTLGPETFDRLRWWLSLDPEHPRQAVLCHGGQQAQRRGDVTVAPWYLQ